MAKPTELDGVNSRTSVRKAAHRLIAARLADVRRYERALSNGISEEAIHDMRVAAHRLRVALFVFGGRNASKLERKVKRLQDALGEIRDLQVQLGWLEKQKNLADAEGIRMLLAELRATLLDREHDLRTALEEWTGNSAPKLEKRLKKVSGKGRFGGKRMQGDLHDSDVRLALLSEFGRTAKAPWKRDLQVVARRVSSDRRRQLRKLRGLVRRWDKGRVLRHLAKRI